MKIWTCPDINYGLQILSSEGMNLQTGMKFSPLEIAQKIGMIFLPLIHLAFVLLYATAAAVKYH